MKGRITFKIKQGEDGDYYWRAVAHNGDIIADGGEGYERKDGAKRALKRFITMIERGSVDIEWEQGKVTDSEGN